MHDGCSSSNDIDGGASGGGGGGGGGGGNAGAGGLDTFLGPTAVAPRLSNSRACTGCSCTARKLSQTRFWRPPWFPFRNRPVASELARFRLLNIADFVDDSTDPVSRSRDWC